MWAEARLPEQLSSNIRASLRRFRRSVGSPCRSSSGRVASNTIGNVRLSPVSAIIGGSLRLPTSEGRSYAAARRRRGHCAARSHSPWAKGQRSSFWQRPRSKKRQSSVLKPPVNTRPLPSAMTSAAPDGQLHPGQPSESRYLCRLVCLVVPTSATLHTAQMEGGSGLKQKLDLEYLLQSLTTGKVCCEGLSAYLGQSVRALPPLAEFGNYLATIWPNMARR